MARPAPTFAQTLPVWLKVGVLGFGGPAGQIALLHREMVETRGWIDDNDFARALSFCMLLPGPEAQQLATWLGWRLHGVRGGLAAGLLFVLPGLAVILGLSALYVTHGRSAWAGPILLGLKAAVVALVVQALLRIGRRTVKDRVSAAVAIGAFALMAFTLLPFPLVILAAGAVGWLLGGKGQAAGVPVAPLRPGGVRVALVCLAAWLAPICLAWAIAPGSTLAWMGLTFGGLAAISFGGAYAALAYLGQAAAGFGWLSASQMLDGLGLAETTPGPLILVTQFVGFLAAYRDAAPFTPLVAGLLGALLTIWVTFAPCFLWIFTFAPWIDRLQHARRLKGALAAITASVVGVIANLSLWFALHVIFTRVEERELGPLRFDWPDSGSIDGLALALAVWAAVHLLVLKRSVVEVLGVAAALGLVVSMFI